MDNYTKQEMKYITTLWRYQVELEELDHLYKNGHIRREDYEAERAEISQEIENLYVS